jgi:hypothetical protein
LNLTNIFNHFMVWLLRSPLHKIASKNTLLITFTGCKSGRRYTTPVNYVLDDNAIYITTLRSRPWWKNLRGGAHVSVCLKGQDMETYGDVIEDYENVTKQRMVYLQLVPQYARYFKISLDPNDNPNLENVAQAAKERVIILLRSG